MGGADDGPQMNMTPFLDLVLQLLMFFIVCANTQAKENNADVKLPDSLAAAVIEGAAQDVIFVNVKPFEERDIPRDLEPTQVEPFKERFRGSPVILVTGKKPMNHLDFKLYMTDTAKGLRGADPAAPITTSIVLRAHKELDYAEVYRVMQTCRNQGFKTFKMRAWRVQTPKGGGG